MVLDRRKAFETRCALVQLAALACTGVRGAKLLASGPGPEMCLGLPDCVGGIEDRALGLGPFQSCGTTQSTSMS